MAKNYRSDGTAVTLTAPAGGVASGAGVLIGALFGVAGDTVAEGELFALGVSGVYELPKAAGALTSGARAYWDAAAKNITTVAAGNYPVGVALADNGDGTALVRLDGVATAAAA